MANSIVGLIDLQFDDAVNSVVKDANTNKRKTGIMERGQSASPIRCHSSATGDAEISLFCAGRLIRPLFRGQRVRAAVLTG